MTTTIFGGCPVGAGVAAEQSRAKAPAAAADDPSAIFGHEVSLVGQQLGIHPEGTP